MLALYFSKILPLLRTNKKSKMLYLSIHMISAPNNFRQESDKERDCMLGHKW
jgi:hypothetical protein